MQWIGVGTAVIVILWTALPFLRHEAWWIRIFDFPRRQIAVLTLASGVLLVAITVFAIWNLRRRPYLAVGWFWFLGVLFPAVGLLRRRLRS